MLVGNAVPPKLAQILAHGILKHIHGDVGAENVITTSSFSRGKS